MGLGVAADALEHEPARLLAEARGLEPRAGRLGVRVRVERQHRVPDVVLDEREAAPRRRVVGVGHAADPVRAGDGLVVPDHGRADAVDQRLGVPGRDARLHGGRQSRTWAAGQGHRGALATIGTWPATTHPTTPTRSCPRCAPVVTRLRDERDELVGLRDAFRDREGSLVEDLIAEAPVPDGDDPELRRIRLRMRGIVDQMQADVAWLDERGIVLRDISTGLLDFPALVSGRPVWLCWRLGEDHVEFWHGTEEGFGGRKPLTALFDDAARA